MLLPKFEYHEPTDLQEACDILADVGRQAKLLAGGTDLLVNMKKNLLSPDHVVSISRIPALGELSVSDKEIRIGACVTAAQLAESEDILGYLGALGQGAQGLGSPLIRNLATVAGNLVSARPAADLPPSLMAYDACVLLKNRSAERAVDLKDFFTGPGQSVIQPGEILKEIIVRRPEPFSGAAYFKLGVRSALEISIVNVAAFVTLDGSGGAIQTARIVLGAVAPTPIRAPSAEKLLQGEKPDEALFLTAGEAAAADSKPIDDFRGSAEYRRDMVAVLTRRALHAALEETKKNREH